MDDKKKQSAEMSLLAGELVVWDVPGWGCWTHKQMTLQPWKWVYSYKLMLPVAFNEYASVVFYSPIWKTESMATLKLLMKPMTTLWFQIKEEKL